MNETEHSLQTFSFVKDQTLRTFELYFTERRIIDVRIKDPTDALTHVKKAEQILAEKC